MLTHIVVWKYRDDVPQETRSEHLAQLARLPEFIPEILSFAVGADVLRIDRSYDTGLVATFRDREALAAYSAHPIHQNAAEFGRGVSQHVASVDFED